MLFHQTKLMGLQFHVCWTIWYCPTDLRCSVPFFFFLSGFQFIYPLFCVSSLPLSPLNEYSFLCPVFLQGNWGKGWGLRWGVVEAGSTEVWEEAERWESQTSKVNVEGDGGVGRKNQPYPCGFHSLKGIRMLRCFGKMISNSCTNS